MERFDEGALFQAVMGHVAQCTVCRPEIRAFGPVAPDNGDTIKMCAAGIVVMKALAEAHEITLNFVEVKPN